MNRPLPPGQFELKEFPRFGLGRFKKYPDLPPDASGVQISGDNAGQMTLDDRLSGLPRVEQMSDFHCVTSWSYRNARWGGIRFRDFYERTVEPLMDSEGDVRVVILRGLDGYSARMDLEDLLSEDVLLADEMDGLPLPPEHGAPIRLVAPALYGFKNVKHIASIEFSRDSRGHRFPWPYPGFVMDHPRGRVAFEERGRWVPAPLLRLVYRLLIPGTIRTFKKETARRGGAPG